MLLKQLQSLFGGLYPFSKKLSCKDIGIHYKLRQMKIHFNPTAFAALLLSTLLISCSNDKTVEAVTDISNDKTSHSWFYFAGNTFIQADKIQNVPTSLRKPWTQAVRISDMSSSATSEPDDSVPAAYAVVNRLGILKISGENAVLYPDESIFESRCAGNLVFFDGTPIYSVYKNSFFNDNSSDKNIHIHPFLVQFSLPQSVSIPIINAENLGLTGDSEVTAFVWDGQYWTCSVKHSGAEKIEFSYLSFQPKEPMSSITPASAKSNILIRKADAESFRLAKKNFDFAEAPERLQKLLLSLPAGMNFTVKCRNAGGHSPRTFLHRGENIDGAPPVSAEALLSSSWAAAVFSDGSVFIQGALDEKPLLNRGKVIALKLPKLPSGFSYGTFAISGSYFYAAWEESEFYEVGKSGFICVNLDKILSY